MKVLVTGSNGMLARDLVRVLEERGHEVIPCRRADLDVTNADAVFERIRYERPDVVFQGAAYTAVDAAESDEREALRVNGEAAAILAEACAEIDALPIYPSTDYVFSGTANRPRRPQDPPAPVNAYGRTKIAGEEALRTRGRHLIVRTSWLYGHGGPNFVETISKLAVERGTLDVVNDQIGIPTWTGSLARALGALIERGVEGILHVTDGGEPTSWYGFAEVILRLRGIEARLRPVPSSGFPRPAPRPAYSVLDTTAVEEILGHALPDWRDSLRQYLESTPR